MRQPCLREVLCSPFHPLPHKPSERFLWHLLFLWLVLGSWCVQCYCDLFESPRDLWSSLRRGRTTSLSAPPLMSGISSLIPTPLSEFRLLIPIQDNLVLIQAGQFIDSTLGVSLGLATMTAAAAGQ